MTPQPTAKDLARDAESDYARLSGYRPTSPQGRIAQWWASWIRRAVAAERERNEYIRQCHEAIALANEKRDQSDKLFMAKCNAEAERDELRAWKESALTLLNRYSHIAESFPGKLGSCMVENLERGIAELQSQLEKFEDNLAAAKEELRRREANGNLIEQRDDLRAERDKLQAFKDWVHAYLDGKSVPHHPPGTHGAAGCRIGDRMDWLFGQFAELRAEVERLKEIIRLSGDGAYSAGKEWAYK